MRLFRSGWVVLSVVFAMAYFVPAFAAAWPATTTGTSIGTNLLALDPTFEASGLVFAEGRGTLVAVSDEGQIAEITLAGDVVNFWSLGSQYDLEDVAVVDASSSLVYLAEENASAALEFDMDVGGLTGRSWDFSSQISEVDG
jgi:uncharacterized protein YjiK